MLGFTPSLIGTAWLEDVSTVGLLEKIELCGIFIVLVVRTVVLIEKVEIIDEDGCHVVGMGFALTVDEAAANLRKRSQDIRKLHQP